MLSLNKLEVVTYGLLEQAEETGKEQLLFISHK
jgi:hypothetical protein